MTRTYRTEGIIIKRTNYGEADRILTIFTKHYGKIKAIAKGVRKTTSKKGGNLELFNDVTLFLSEGRNLDIITEAEVINSFEKTRGNLNLVGQAFQIAEVADRLTAEREENRRVFELLRKSFQDLNRGKREAVLSFEIELLKELGFGLPEDLSEKSVERFIESIIEKKLKSKRIFPISDPRSE